MNVSCARISADDDPGDVGVAQLVGDRAEADLGELGDEQVGGERDQRRAAGSLAGGPAAAATSSGDSRWPVAAAAALAEILERHLVRAREVAQVRRERGPLEVGQRAADGIVPSRRRRAAVSARSGPTSTVQATSSSATSMSIADCGAPSVAAERSTQHRPVRRRRATLLGVEPAVGDAGRVQARRPARQRSSSVSSSTCRGRRARAARRRAGG